MKNICLLLLMILMAKAGIAQYSLTFCEDVSNNGKPQRASNFFMVDKQGSALKLLLKSDEKLNTDLNFKVFYINDSGKEEEVSRLPQKVEPDWDYVWKEIVFFDAGNYKVKVYNAKGQYLTSAGVKIKQQ